MASDLSLRHLPDPSDSLVMPDFSESSFQIPHAVDSNNDFLLDDESMDFLRSADDTLRTPAPPTQLRNRQPLTLADLTPKPKTVRATPIRSSLRPRTRPTIATPRRTALATDLHLALTETLSPLRGHDQETSFQIPMAAARGHDFLLDDVDNAVETAPFSSASVPIQEPDPLTLSQLTPKRNQLSAISPCSEEHEAGSKPLFFSPARENAESLEQSNLAGAKLTTRQLADTTAQVSELGRDKGSAPSTKPKKELSHGEKTRRKKSVVIGGGITKPGKPRLPRSTVSRIISATTKQMRGNSQRRPVQDTRTAESGTMVGDDGLTKAGPSKTTVSSEDSSDATINGLVGALMSYGQKSAQYSNTETIDMSETRASIITSTNPDAETHVSPGSSSENVSVGLYRDADRETPPSSSQSSRQAIGALALVDARRSQPGPSTSANEKRPLSPSHPSVKRPPSAASSASHHKRSKTFPTHTDKQASDRITSKVHERVRQRSQVKAANAPPLENNCTIASESHLRHVSADPEAKEVESRPGPSNPNSRSSSSVGQHGDKKPGSGRQLTHTRVPPADCRSTSRSGDLRDSQKENRPDARAPRLDQSHRAGQMPTFDKPAVTLPPAKPTRPIEFHFQSDARVEARKAELEKSNSMQKRSRSHAPLPIPDFKAMHAAQELASAARREQIVPVVPLEIELNTDARARERERFDGARREREREIEQQMEERRRLRELEEEKEIKELRRRAVPKANEVPEWYANAPKRSGNAKS